MDWISQLSDELFFRILSLLPTAKEVVATMVLSKRWQFLWMFVPTLVYDDSYQDIDYGRFSRFVDRSLLLHEAPVIETLHFRLGKTCGPGDIRVWIRVADKCSVRRLIIEFDNSSSASPAILPRSLFTGCRMLVKLSLNNATFVGVSSSVSFPSLKTLSLLSMKYPNDEFVKRLLSGCLVLEELVVERAPNDNVTIFTVIVPFLKSLLLRESNTVRNDARGFVIDARGFVIDAPSLECFDVLDHRGGFCIIENDMPQIVMANVDIFIIHPGKVLGSITSAKRLYLCLTISKDAYPTGCIFRCLVYLKICTCETEWLNLLMRVLKDSPKLRALKLEQYHPLRAGESRPCWIEPTSVPECVLLSLETLEWEKYEGTEEEKEVVAFILRSGCYLKKVTVNPPLSTTDSEKLKMIKELSFLPRSSPTCRLSFD